jgi:hypothetical protein
LDLLLLLAAGLACTAMFFLHHSTSKTAAEPPLMDLHALHYGSDTAQPPGPPVAVSNVTGPHGGASSSRAIVMCAFNTHSARMAWMQIKVLQEIYGMTNETFLIYHADEFKPAHDRALRNLKSLPRVKVRSLKPWHSRTFPGQDVKRLAGFYCKPAALLAAEEELVVLLDLDAVVLENPFSLIHTTPFQYTGSYFFTDRRFLDMGFHSKEDAGRLNEDWVAVLRDLWHILQPDKPQLSRYLLDSPAFRGFSKEYGESAMVVYDKGRNPEAARMLQRMLEPRIMDHLNEWMYGDKELYWLSFAMAGRPPGMNPWAWTSVGIPWEGDRICEVGFTLGQWAELLGDREPRVIYLNGDGVEDAITKEGFMKVMKKTFISRPKPYYEIHPGFCAPRGGEKKVEGVIFDKLKAYKRIYED